jgi:hypothetical protein
MSGDNLTSTNNTINISANSNVWNFSADGVLTLPGNIIAINYANSNRVTGNITFKDEIVIGTGTSNLISGLYLAPSSSSADANMYLRVRGNINDEPTHIHFDTGNNQYYNQFIGDDNKYIQLANTGNIVINSNDGVGNSAQWNFGTTGNITLPGNSSSINYANGSPYGGSGNANTGNVTFNDINVIGTGNLHLQPDPANASAYLDVYLTTGPDIHIGGNGESVILGTDAFANVTVNVNGNVSVQANAGTPYTWTFGTTGNLTAPGYIVLDDGTDGNIDSTGNINIISNNNTWTFGDDGNLFFPTGNLIITPSYAAFSNAAVIISRDHNLITGSTGANGGTSSLWVEDYANISTSNIAAVYANPTPGSRKVRIAVGLNGSPGPNLWDFDATGNTTFPSDGNVNLGNVAIAEYANFVVSAFIGNGSANIFLNYDGSGNFSGNLTSANANLGNLATANYVNVSGNITSGNANLGNIAIANYFSTSGTGGDIVLTGGNISGANVITANTFVGNGSQLTDITASVPSQTILPTIQSITISATSSGGTGGGSGWANVTVANTIPVTEYGVIVTNGTISQKYVTGSLGSIPGTVQLNITTGLNTTPFTVYAYVTSNAGTYYSNSATGTSGICLLAGTQIALSDGTYKAIEDITYTDKMLSWDFDRGCYAETTALWIKYSETGSQYNLLTFSDGTTLRTFDQHRIFNKQAGAFTYPMTDATPIGTVTVNEHGQEITLTNKQVIQDTIEYYNVITDYHMNLFSDSVLTSCRFNNIYPITDMKFVKDARTLRTRDEFENVPDRFFNGLRLAEQTTDIETVEWYVNRLLSSEVSTHAELAV